MIEVLYINSQFHGAEAFLRS